jgi:hypothetical protein
MISDTTSKDAINFKYSSIKSNILPPFTGLRSKCKIFRDSSGADVFKACNEYAANDAELAKTIKPDIFYYKEDDQTKNNGCIYYYNGDLSLLKRGCLDKKSALKDTVNPYSVCQYIKNDSGKYENACLKRIEYLKNYGSFPLFSYGVGMPAITLNMKTRNFGYLKAVDPIFGSVNYAQSSIVVGPDIYNTCFTSGIGLSVSGDSTSIQYGATVMAFGLRINSFSIGLGAGWMSTNGHFSSALKNLNWALPISYSFL